MERTPHLLRDYGLTLALIFASVWLFWKTMLPQIRRNHELDESYLELREENRRAEEEVKRLKLLQDAGQDPLEFERKAREYYGDLVLPPDEVFVEEDR